MGFVLLDVEGHEEQALLGAIGLIRQWRPVLATEKDLTRLPLYMSELVPLGYREDGSCPGLHFYSRARAAAASRRRQSVS